jgi:hypothetical protein
MDALSPRGGSFVILIPFLRINVGNCVDGYELSQSLKDECVVSDESELVLDARAVMLS